MSDLALLKDFLVLCQVRSFSRASERCHVSVSGLSRRIQQLEQWAGAALFDRRKAALELTPAGVRLQAVATEVTYALEGLRKAIRAEQAGALARVAFAAPHILSPLFFADWIPRLHSDVSQARFSVEADELGECFAMLDEGGADCVVALFDPAGAVVARLGKAGAMAGYRGLTLGRERLLPVSVPAEGGGPVFAPGRAAVSFLGYAETCHLGWSLQAMLARHPELALRPDHRASLTDGIRAMALAGLGVAWLPERLVAGDLAVGRLVRAASEAFDVPLDIRAYRRPGPLAPQVEALWDYLEQSATA